MGDGPRDYRDSLQSATANPLAYRNFHAYILEVNFAYGSLAFCLFLAMLLYPLLFLPAIFAEGRAWLVIAVLLVVVSTFAPSSYFRYHYWLVLPWLIIASFKPETHHVYR